jgi:hypothetical protein
MYSIKLKATRLCVCKTRMPLPYIRSLRNGPNIDLPLFVCTSVCVVLLVKLFSCISQEPLMIDQRFFTWLYNHHIYSETHPNINWVTLTYIWNICLVFSKCLYICYLKFLYILMLFWGPSGRLALANGVDTILKGDHPSTINLAKFRNTFFTANSGGFINSCKGYTFALLVCMTNDFLASILTDNSSHFSKCLYICYLKFLYILMLFWGPSGRLALANGVMLLK